MAEVDEEIIDEKQEKNDEKPHKKSKKTSVVAAASSGNRKRILIALRDKLAETIEKCESGRDMAANSRQLLIVTEELENIKAEEKRKKEAKAAAKNPSKRDQLRKRNAAR